MRYRLLVSLVLFRMVAFFENIRVGVSSPPKFVTLGAVFSDRLQADYEAAFRLAIYTINNNKSILPNTELRVIVNKTATLDAFKNIEMVQYLIHQGVVAIVGPMTSTGVKFTQPYCAGFHIPQLAPVATDPTFAFTPANFPYLVRLSPSDTIQCQALAGLISHYNWTQISLLTSNDDYGINGLLALKDIANQKGWKITANEHFDPVSDFSTLNVNPQLVAIRKTHTRIVVLNTLARYTVVILTQAAQLGMLKDWVWIVTDGSTNTDWSVVPGDYPLHEFYGVIGTRPSFGAGKLYPDFNNQWKSRGHDQVSTPGGKSYDAALVVAAALDRMIKDGLNVKEMSLEFDFEGGVTAKPWPPGQKLKANIKNVSIDGLMSSLSFDEHGSPRNAEYDIVNLGRTGFIQVGHWSTRDGVVMDPRQPVIWLSGSVNIPKDTSTIVENTTIRVVTVIEKPFVFVKESKTGKKTYTGLCIDLLDKLKEKMKFRYTIEESPGNVYGAPDVFSGEWSGMVRYLDDNKADLAIGPFTISSSRQTVIDFTQPFMDVGLSIIMRKEEDSEYKVFSFLRPFDVNLWLAIVSTTLVVGVFLWLHSTFSPYGYHGRVAQATDTRTVTRDEIKAKDHLRFFNAIWSSFAYYVSQGPDVLHPVSLSGRIAVGVWWFAVLIIGATYTANLASFLIVQRFQTPVQSVEDLARQTKIEYGIPGNGQTQTYFQTSSIPTYVTMWEFMKSSGTILNNSTEGINRVREGNFAFIFDSVVLKYHVHQPPCNTLYTVGRVFGKFGYGFGLQKNSPFTHHFSINVLELRQKGYMETMKSKWLGGTCEEDETDSQSSSSISTSGDVLTFTDLSGVFYCVLFGMASSLLVLLVELFIEAHKDTKENNKEARVEALKRRVLTSWRAYQGPSRPTPSSVDPVDAPQSFQTSKHLNSLPRTNSSEELSIEDLEKRRSSELNGFANGKGLESEKSAPGYRRSSMV
ncbi:hypothetical protein OS493_018961 [Desmophyllum pertusum]|uniref:Glutamate receptor n=1 Tax=Desmophyllum pertusum TaxID=174260 RepID=A0A9W9Z175_9CNID|nr:hypothetical protein OS493_018961 [Desmophyllum pertusum]